MRNIFVSYSHRLDQKDVDDFRKKFADDRMVFF
ncbi:TIR domain-containing protein (plasmid) [Clostridium perfringens]|nr:TIR domain-containing protein [Clostridium perfringens]